MPAAGGIGVSQAFGTDSGRLKGRRRAVGLTLEQAAAVLQVPPRSYHAWESEETIPLEVTQEGAFAQLENTSRE